jgi:hypothetical protein
MALYPFFTFCAVFGGISICVVLAISVVCYGIHAVLWVADYAYTQIRGTSFYSTSMDIMHAVIAWMHAYNPVDRIELYYMGAIIVMMICIGLSHHCVAMTEQPTAASISSSDEEFLEAQLRESHPERQPPPHGTIRRSARIAVANGARRSRAYSSN